MWDYLVYQNKKIKKTKHVHLRTKIYIFYNINFIKEFLYIFKEKQKVESRHVLFGDASKVEVKD